VQLVKVEEVISQLELSDYHSDSVFLKVTLYPVIGEPPISGATQETTTLSGTQVVVGGLG
jgi:hypothetical protein